MQSLHQLEIAMMRCFADFAPKQAVRGSAAVLAAALLVAACGTGIAAFAGLLPKSDGVATAVTATPLVELQTTMMNLIESGFEDTSTASN
ncbi:hypothetical protein QF000_001736 [Paraburkholderia atlantica]|uniref:Uncharacterized protein n=2 Tax=Paraburkholderia atlantica TaxID=2654982 RepID=A0A7W8QBC4_PARAM|nr:hypothetical protein [Paraburkholderia atlantica]MBB5427175.1 hypothetical protein [Paraburkholderia atlantica]MBB5508773.1 hypothetical protein [Paraburkholderia atlantica]